MHQITVSLSKPHTYNTCVFLYNLQPGVQFGTENDRDLSRAGAVTRGWNGYRSKSAQKVDPEKKKNPVFPPLLPGIEPATFRRRVRRFTDHKAIPAPRPVYQVSVHDVDL